MSLQSGQKLLHYRLVEQIGAGGMGVVWRAEDTKLDREVAIKVLPDGFAGDTERLARFEREGKLLASLSHPNIAVIHGLDEALVADSGKAIRFLVMELVPGEDLAQRLERGPLGRDEALAVCGQVAAALDAAHGQGIIHRDLKPANIKVTPDNTVKVLDFGLAKVTDPAESSPDPSRSPTRTLGGTLAGTILGTAAYMSPEQARGMPLDKRTDIWSFGCVLCECLTGKRLYARETATDTLAAVLEHEPDLTGLPAATPPGVVTLIRRCVQKDLKRRLRDIGDAAIELEESGGAVFRADPAGHKNRSWYWVAGLLAVLGLIAGVVVGQRLGRSERSTPQRVSRLAALLPEGEPIAVGARPSLALSPDGSLLTYVGGPAGRTQLYLRSLATFESVPLPDTSGADLPFFSPDGQSIGFLVGNLLKKVSVAGGAPVTITSMAPVARGFSWAAGGDIVVAPSKVSGLWRRTEAESEILTTIDPELGEINHCWPQALTAHSKVLVTAQMQGSDSYDDANIVVIDSETGSRKTLVEGGYHGRIVSSGHLLYVRSGTLLAARVDLDRWELESPAVPVLEGFVTDPTSGAAWFSVAEDGTLAYVAGGVHQGGRGRLVWVDRQGSVVPVLDQERAFRYPRVSPDGSRLSFTIEETYDDVWIYEMERGTLRRLTFEHRNIAPVWRPGSEDLIFSSVGVSSVPQIHFAPVDGSADAEPLLRSDGQPLTEGALFPGSWSADGQVLGVTRFDLRTGWDVLLYKPDAEQPLEPFLDTRFEEVAPVFSPDGGWVAYTSNESGRQEIYVQPFPGPGAKTRVSIDGGSEPVWSRTGNELFYRVGDRLMAVAVEVRPEFRASRPTVLFEGSYYYHALAWLTSYDVDVDGSRFLMVEEEPQPTPRHIQIVLNWLAELK